MQVEMHGKRIEFIDLDPRWTQSGNPERIQSGAKDTAMQIIHGVLWCYSARSGSFASVYAFDSLTAALKPYRETLEGLWRLEEMLSAKRNSETQPAESK